MKVTKLTKLLISFMGGGKIDFPTRHLREVEIEGDGLDGGGGDQEEVDVVKQHIDNFVLFSKENGSEIDYLDNIFYKTYFLEDISISEIPEGHLIGDVNNFDYVLRDMSTIDPNDEEGIPTFILLTNEQLQYLNDKLVNNSFKDFIISTLNISDLSVLFEEYNVEGNDFSEVVAMNKEDFKFFIGSIDEDTRVGTGMILDDFDVKYVGLLESMNYVCLAIFNNNETRKIFNSSIGFDENTSLGILLLDTEKSLNKKLNAVLNDENYIIYGESEPEVG